MISAHPGNALVPELAVTDWKASKSFYCGVLGFEVKYERPDEGFALLRMGDAELMIDQMGLGRTLEGGHRPETYPFGKGVNFQIRVPNVQSVLERANAAQSPIILPLEDKWYVAGDVELGNSQFIVADPDGYLLRMTQELGSRPL